MKKEILINHTPEETRIALLEESKLAEFFLDRATMGSSHLAGNIYCGEVVNVLPGMQSAFLNLGLKKSAYLPFDELLSSAKSKSQEPPLKKGDLLLIQVVKEPIGTKGAKVTQEISLPGRYLVYLPLEEKKKIHFSRQITDRKEHARLKNILETLSLPEGTLIVRTEAEGAEKKDLQIDLEYLKHLWVTVQSRQKKNTFPQLLHQEISPVYRVFRDLFSEEVVSVLIDSLSLYKDILDYVEIISPELKERIHHYSGRTPIFTAYKIEEEIKKIYQPKVKLPSGGYIFIQETESLCAIDVNTGKFTSGKTLEETVLKTNLEAAKEIARQIRLRNLGGIIVVDFIKLEKEAHRRDIYATLCASLKEDKAKLKILPSNRLGLIELTRERKRPSLVSVLTEECKECHGAGRLLSRESLYFSLRKEILNLKNSFRGGKLYLRLHPDLLEYFQNYRADLQTLANQEIEFISDPSLKRDDYQLVISGLSLPA